MGDIPGFRPSINALHYSNNTWPSVPDLTLSTPFGNIGIGDASNGLCGGMVFGVRDLFDAGEQPPATTTNPAGGSPAFNYIVARLFDSFNIPAGVAEYYTWMNLPTHDTLLGAKGTSDLTINQTMPTIRASIDAGQPCPIGLVCVHSTDPTMLGHNHQVLAWGYEDTPTNTTVKVYDPNHPDDDGVTISFDPTNPTHTTAFNYSTNDNVVLGFFACTWYGPKDPSPLGGSPFPPPPPLPVLETSCQPNTITLATPQTFEVTAKDRNTSRPVTGNVLVNGLRVGMTGVQLRYTFTMRVIPGRPGTPPHLLDPVVNVEATGYQYSPVAISFRV
jgi:hypothetical protein